jgi:GDP-L-fucose synthase
MEWWAERRVAVTGGAGFLGSFVVERLRARGCRQIFVVRRRDYDLREPEAIIQMYRDSRPEIVIHLAAAVGGIEANRRHPGKFFYDNAIMGLQLLEQARRHHVHKFVCVGTICAYPKFTPIPFKEEDLWNGYPEETNAPYGLAKKMLLVQAQAYRREYGFKAIYLLPVNLYGPRDNFDLETSHVIPALIRKMVEARDRGEEKIVAWGSGRVSREFLYVEDAAEAIVLAAEHYDQPEPVNVGTGYEITIRELAQLIARLVGFGGQIEWDSSRPDGQPRRCLDTARAKEAFGFEAQVSLDEGLRRTIAWYEVHRPSETRKEHGCEPKE